MAFNKEMFDATLQAVKDHEIMITPAFDGGARVMVLRDDAAKQVGRIHIPETHQKVERKGTVVATSERGENDRYMSSVAIGKRVSFNSYDGTIHQIPAIVGGEPTQIEVVVLHISALYLTWRNTDVDISTRIATEDREV